MQDRHGLSAMEISSFPIFNRAVKGLLHTHIHRLKRSDYSSMVPFLLSTLKLGSDSETSYSFAPSQRQQKQH